MLRLSVHAEQRRLERGITMGEIRHTVANHEVSFPDRKGNRCFVREINGRRIKVVLAANDPEFVITVVDLDSDG
jgi:hypothetical protein